MTTNARMNREGRSRIADGLALGTVIALLAAPLAALQPFEWGGWRLTSGSILLMYLGGALSAAALLAATCLPGNAKWQTVPARPVLAVAAGGLFLAAGGVAGALLAEFPLLSIAGTYQSGLGILWFLHFALAVLFFGVFDRDAAWQARLDRAMLLSLCAVGVTLGIDLLMPNIVLLLPGGDSYAYLGAAGIAYSFAGAGLTGRMNRLILPVSLILVAISGNMAAWGITAVLGTGIVVTRFRPSVLSGLAIFRRPLPALILLLATIIGPACAFHVLPQDVLPASLQSRVHIYDLSFAVLAEASATEWLFGIGWGHVQSAYYANLLAAEYPIYLQEWDFLWRDIFHSHNGALEALLATGLVGLAVHCAVFWLAIRHVARIGRAALWFLLLFYLVMAGLWFEFSFALPFLALAAVRCLFCVGTEPMPDVPAPSVAGPAWYGGLVAAILVFSVALVRLGPFEAAVAGHKFDTLVENPQTSIRLETFPRDPRGTHFVESIVLRELWRKRDRLRESRGWSDDSTLALALLDRAESVLADIDASPMLLVGLSVLNDLAYYKGEAMQRLALQRVDLWERLVRRHWELEPKRSDVSVGYFELLKRAGAFDRLQTLTEERLRVAPNDPVAIFYGALASLHRVPAEQNPEAMRSILRAIDLGLRLILPIEETFESELRRDYGGGPDEEQGT